MHDGLTPPGSWAEVRSVLFDLNGTLVDDVPRATDATNHALSQLALPGLSRARFRSAFRLPLTAFFEDLWVPAARSGAAVEAWNAAMAARRAPLMPGAVELLTWLRQQGVGTALVSAAGCAAVRADVDALRLTGLLDDVHCGVTDKQAVLEAAVRTCSGAVLYVGDTEYDVTSAQAAGAWPVALSAGYRTAADLRKVSPWRLVDSLAEVSADGFWHR